MTNRLRHLQKPQARARTLARDPKPMLRGSDVILAMLLALTAIVLVIFVSTGLFAAA